jgi:hypothetical protein
MHSQSALIFFLFKFWGGRGGMFFIFHLVPTCSFQVPNGFPICSPREFLIAPRFSSHRVAQLLFAHGKWYLIEKQGGLWERGYFLFGLVWPSTHKRDTPFFPFDAIQLDEPKI